MTFSEMHERIDVLLDKHDLPWFEPDEKDIHLNFALNEIVKNRHALYEVNEKRRQDLRTITLMANGSGGVFDLTSIPGGVDNFMFAIAFTGRFDITKCGVTTVETRSIAPVQHDVIHASLGDPFNKPTNSNPVYIAFEDEFQIFSDTAPSSTTLTYLKRPDPIDGTNNPAGESDLPEHMHEVVVNVAVRKILGNIESQKYPVQQVETQNQE